MRVIAAAVVLVCSLSAQIQTPLEGTVARMIERLGSPRAELADGAMVGLIRGGTASVPLLRKVLAKTENPRVLERAGRALAICTVDAPIVKGLKVGLTVDRPALAVGEAVVLTSTVCNVSDAPIAIYLGMSYSGNVLENGLALQASGLEAEAPTAQARFGSVGFCGTGATAIVVVLAPWTSQQFHTQAILCATAEKDGIIPHDGPHLNMGHTFLPLPEKAKVWDVKVTHTVAVQPEIGAFAGAARSGWQGTLVSNAVRLEVRAKAGR